MNSEIEKKSEKEISIPEETEFNENSTNISINQAENKIKDSKEVLIKTKSFKKDLNVVLKFENNDDDFNNQQKYISLKKKQRIDSSLISNELLDQSQYKFGLYHNCDTVLNKSPKFKFEDICFLYYYTEVYNRCPICLEDHYVIPIITRCGHIFCLPCIISYYNYTLNSNSETKKKIQVKCPLCSNKLLNKFQDITFCEIIESRKYVAEQISNNDLSKSKELFIKFNLVFRHNYMIYNTHYDSDLKFFENEYQNLSYSEYNDKYTNFSSIFIVYLDTLNDYYQSIKEKLEQLIKFEFNQYSPLDQNEESKFLAILECIEYVKSLSEKIFKKKQSNNEINKKLDQVSVKKQDKKYFYQEVNGDIYYLHPLNYSMIMHEFKSTSYFPTEISVSF